MKLHIISFDIPFPADYGGVIDVFYKLKALHSQGIGIHLHCYEYGRRHAQELERLCETVNYYPRKVSKRLLLNSKPYIVVTRESEEMLRLLLKDDHPILIEGLHCCSILDDPRLANRKKVVRMHNIEHHYYAALAQAEKNFFRKKYFKSESGKLKRFESILKHASAIAAISPADTSELTKRYKNVTNIIAFHPHEEVQCKTGTGRFVLYHGSLSVAENNRAALYLVNEVFADAGISLIIAGNGASNELKNAIAKAKHIELRENISTEEIYSLISDAHINVLPTFQATGIKLKLLSALYTGRHCLVNRPMIEGTGLESLCTIVNDAKEMRRNAEAIMKQEFTTWDIEKRKVILEKEFSNTENVRKLIQLLA